MEKVETVTLVEKYENKEGDTLLLSAEKDEYDSGITIETEQPFYVKSLDEFILTITEFWERTQ